MRDTCVLGDINMIVCCEALDSWQVRQIVVIYSSVEIVPNVPTLVNTHFLAVAKEIDKLSEKHLLLLTSKQNVRVLACECVQKERECVCVCVRVRHYISKSRMRKLQSRLFQFFQRRKPHLLLIFWVIFFLDPHCAK